MALSVLDHGPEGPFWQRFASRRHALLVKELATYVPALISSDDYRRAMEACARLGIEVPQRFL